MYNWNKICGLNIFFLLFALTTSAQKAADSLSNPPQPQMFTALRLAQAGDRQNIKTALSLRNMISPNYYTQHLGFICKKEIALEKVTKIPLRIRLGSLQQCNYLEGKK